MGGRGQKFLIWVKMRLHTEFQLPIMPVSGPKVCGVGGGGGGWWVCKPISVLSFGQAEQYEEK